MELKQPDRPIYSLKDEWERFIEEQRELIDYTKNKLIPLATQIETFSYQDCKIPEGDDFELNVLKYMMEQKIIYNNQRVFFDGFFLITPEGKLDIDAVLNLLFDRLFKRNAAIELDKKFIDNRIIELSEYLISRTAVPFLIGHWNKSFNSKDPSIAKLTFDNIEILAYNTLFKRMNRAESKATVYDEYLNESAAKYESQRAELIESYDKHINEQRSTYNQKIEDQSYLIDNLKEEVFSLKSDIKLGKEHFLSFCVFNLDIPDLRILFNTIAPLNLFFDKENIDFTRFCWFFDQMKFNSKVEDKIVINFKKSSTSAKEFGKFLHILKTDFFNHKTGYSFEQWLGNNFIFISSRNKITEMDRFIRKYDAVSNPPSMEKYSLFLDTCYRKMKN